MKAAVLSVGCEPEKGSAEGKLRMDGRFLDRNQRAAKHLPLVQHPTELSYQLRIDHVVAPPHRCESTVCTGCDATPKVASERFRMSGRCTRRKHRTGSPGT